MYQIQKCENFFGIRIEISLPLNRNKIKRTIHRRPNKSYKQYYSLITRLEPLIANGWLNCFHCRAYTATFMN